MNNVDKAMYLADEYYLSGGRVIRYELLTHLESMEADRVRLIDASKKVLNNFENLLALVRGECPSLLNEDSGGNGMFSVDCDEHAILLIAAINQSKEQS